MTAALHARRLAIVLFVAGVLLAILPIFLLSQPNAALPDAAPAGAEKLVVRPEPIFLGEQLPSELPPDSPNQQSFEDGWLIIDIFNPDYLSVGDPGKVFTITIANNHGSQVADNLAVTATLPAALLATRM